MHAGNCSLPDTGALGHQSSYFMPEPVNHYFIDLALCAGHYPTGIEISAFPYAGLVSVAKIARSVHL